MRTAIGVVSVVSMTLVDPSEIPEGDAHRGRFASADDLRSALDGFGDGSTYRIELAYVGEDPRIALRNDDDLDDATFEHLRTRLARMDARSPHGPWTQAVLRAIEAQPGRRAPDLAAEFGRQTAPFKTHFFKFKEPGPPESLRHGFQLSPRGHALLD